MDFIFITCRTLITRLLEKQADYQSRLQELLRGLRGHAPREKSWKIGLSETPYPAFPGSNANNTCTLFSFSQSLFIHDSRAEVQRFMIPKFLKQKFMIFTCFVSMISLRPIPWARLVSLCTKFPRRLFWVMKRWQIHNLPFKNMFTLHLKFFLSTFLNIRDQESKIKNSIYIRHRWDSNPWPPVY